MNKFRVNVGFVVAFSILVPVHTVQAMHPVLERNGIGIFGSPSHNQGQNQSGSGQSGQQGQNGSGQGNQQGGQQGQGGFVQGGAAMVNGSVSDETLIALKKEQTKQLELANTRDLALENERGRWFQVLKEYDDSVQTQLWRELLEEHEAFLADELDRKINADKDLQEANHKHEEKMERLRQQGAPEANKYKLQAQRQEHSHDIRKQQEEHEYGLKKWYLLGQGLEAFTQDKDRMKNVALFLGVSALGIYMAKRSTKVAADYTASWLMKPSLVTETSRRGLHDILNPKKAKKEVLATPLYNAGTQKQVETYVASIKHGAKQDQPFRHGLFYGAPGTGKTLLAKKIAKDLGMDYAIINAANISQFSDQDAIIEINKIFDWAERSRTVLFFDEVDAIAAKRLGNVSEHSRKVLNTLLARTGTETKKFLMIGATNEPNLLDPAYLSRMDERIEFEHPDRHTRLGLIKQYFNTYITKGTSIKVPDDIEHHVEWVAHKTEGFSGRELSQLVRAFRAELALSEDKTITPELMQQVVAQKIAQRDNLQNYGTSAVAQAAVTTQASIPSANLKIRNIGAVKRAMSKNDIVRRARSKKQ